MGEKPMGALDEDDQDPESAAAGINTTRSNIKHAGAAAGSGDAGPSGEPGGTPGVSAAGQPIPGVDVIVKKHTR